MMTTAASVTLLFNNNLSPRLPRLLADLYPGSLHLKDLDMRGSGDSRVWEYAKDHGFAIVTKDRDYKDMSGDLGHPPKVVLITLAQLPQRGRRGTAAGPLRRRGGPASG